MSPEDIRLIIEEIKKENFDFPWWGYLLAFIVSSVGAYFGAYFKRKAEDRAAQENFDNIRTQLIKNTNDTEEIKITLSRKSWLTQQQWAIREQHYMSLLSELTKFKISLEDRDACFLEPGSEHNSSISESEYYKALSQNGSKSYKVIRELIGPSSVFLSKKAIDALENLVLEHWSVSEFSACSAEYASKALKLVGLAIEAVLEEARNELHMVS